MSSIHMSSIHSRVMTVQHFLVILLNPIWGGGDAI